MIATAAATMPARVSGGLAGRSRRLRGSPDWTLIAAGYTNEIVTNKFVANMFANGESAGSPLEGYLAPPLRVTSPALGGLSRSPFGGLGSGARSEQAQVDGPLDRLRARCHAEL